MNLAIMMSVCHALCRSPGMRFVRGTDLAELTESARGRSHRGLQPTRKGRTCLAEHAPIPPKPYYDPDWHADEIEAIFKRSRIPGLAADVQGLDEPGHAITRPGMKLQVTPADLTPAA